MFKSLKSVVASFALLLTLSGCGGQWLVEYDAPVDPALSNQWRVASVEVVAPAALRVSKADTLAPEAEIVWWGEPDGDRRAQVTAIVQAGIAQGAGGLNGSIPVHFRVELNHFHSVTPRAQRLAPSAVHNIGYTLRVIDARTGQDLIAPVQFEADLEAYLGQQADAAKAQGVTERDRIIAHVANLTAGWLGLAADPRRTFSSMGR